MNAVSAVATDGTAWAGDRFTQSESGVTIYLDRENEEYYIEVAPRHIRKTLFRFSRLADVLGFEVMPEQECPPENLPTGSVRHWMVEKESCDDRSAQ